MDGIRVLYVEDDPTDRDLTLRHLRLHAPEIEMQIVATGAEALDRLRAGGYNIVLMDYNLPDVEGFNLLVQVVASVPTVSVIMVTGAGDHEVAVTALKLGAADYVAKKPGYLDRLPTVIREALGRSTSDRARRASGLRILYAEHEPLDIALMMKHMAVHAAHLNVETVSTGKAALRELVRNRHDLFLLDYRLPDINGLELLQEMRALQIRLPVVMVTGHGDEETAVQAIKLGATDYVVKREGYLIRLPFAIEKAIAQWALAVEKETLLTLNGVAWAVASILDLREVLRRVAASATSLLKADRSLVSLLSDDGTELIPAAWHGVSAEVANRLRFRTGQNIPGRAAALRRAVSIPDFRLAEEKIWRELPESEAVRGVLSVPVVAHDRLLGVLTVAATMPRTFSAWEEGLLASLAAHAAVGIDNARLYEEQRLAALQLEAKVEERTRDLQVARDQLEEALRRVEITSQHKSQFLANMSHELRTPLNSILGFAELLQDPQFEPITTKQGRYLGHIHSSGQHLLVLINDLLDLSKVEAGRLELRPETFPLAEALTAALEPFRIQVDAKGVTLALQVDHAPAHVVADPLRVKQMLYNLVSNAVKFTPPGGAITVIARRGSSPTPGDFVEIAVSDTGIGIKAEDLGRLFQEFTQLDSSFAKPQQGTGLGLALTKRLAELHGGYVAVTSPGEGQGSTFTITLPVRPPWTGGEMQQKEQGEGGAAPLESDAKAREVGQ